MTEYEQFEKARKEVAYNHLIIIKKFSDDNLDHIVKSIDNIPRWWKERPEYRTNLRLLYAQKLFYTGATKIDFRLMKRCLETITEASCDMLEICEERSKNSNSRTSMLIDDGSKPNLEVKEDKGEQQYLNMASELKKIKDDADYIYEEYLKIMAKLNVDINEGIEVVEAV
tara:strand:+ start:8938 stop:9447 length:510 start_codon:yes stop_codon:yes gene_type:complete